jgi:hypothetical protein
VKAWWDYRQDEMDSSPYYIGPCLRLLDLLFRIDGYDLLEILEDTIIAVRESKQWQP